MKSEKVAHGKRDRDKERRRKGRGRGGKCRLSEIVLGAPVDFQGFGERRAERWGTSHNETSAGRAHLFTVLLLHFLSLHATTTNTPCTSFSTLSCYFVSSCTSFTTNANSSSSTTCFPLPTLPLLLPTLPLFLIVLATLVPLVLQPLPAQPFFSIASCFSTSLVNLCHYWHFLFFQLLFYLFLLLYFLLYLNSS